MNRAQASLFLLFAVTGCLGTNCVNKVRQELLSPDGRKKIVLFSRSCGATTGINTQASVLDTTANFPNETGNAFIVDKGSAKVSWKNDSGILVVIDPGARIFKKEPSVGNISIEYRE